MTMAPIVTEDKVARSDVRRSVVGKLAGEIQSTLANTVRWIQHPQHIERGTVMREMEVTENDARDIAPYLCTLR